MKILVLIGSLRGGGAERQVRYLASALSQRNHQLTIALIERGSEQGSLDSVPVFALRASSGNWLSAILRLRSIAQEFDVIYSFMDAANVLAAIATRGLQIGRVWGLRNSGVTQSLVAKGSFTLARLLSRSADAAICNSQAVQNFYRDSGFAPGRWEVIANGVALTIFHPARRVEQLNIGVKNLDLSGTVVGMIARADGFKRHDLFFGMVAQLKERFPEVTWLIAGLGTEESNGRIASLMSEYGVSDCVAALGEVADVPALVASLDVAVCSSDFEGSSNSILESLACAVPVVSFEVGDASSMLSTCGVVVPQRTAKALAEAVARLLDDPVRRAALGKAGRRIAQERYSVERMTLRTEGLLQSVVASEAEHVS